MNSRPSDFRTEPLFQTAIWLVLFALPMLVAVSAHVDADAWWHLRSGQWIVTEGKVPAADPFSSFGQETGKPWIAYSWLFEIMLYASHAALGPAGIVMFRLLLLLVVLLTIHRFITSRVEQFASAVIITAAAFIALIPLGTERPWLVSILGCTLTLQVIYALREGVSSRWSWFLPVFYVFWANVHVQFVYGLLLLAIACAAPILDRVCHVGERNPADLASQRRLLTLSALCGLATLVNPYGWRLYSVVLDFAFHPAAHRHITELQALEFRSWWDWCVLGLAGFAAVRLGRQSPRSWFEVMLLLLAAWFGFRTRRDLWFLVVAASAILCTAGSSSERNRNFVPKLWQYGALALALLALVSTYWTHQLSGGKLESALAHEYPVAAVEHVRADLEAGRCHGPLYNHYDWGGYLIWSLPELPVSMDGRSNLHGDDRLDRMMTTWQGLPGWDRDPELTRAGVVIAPVRTALSSLLLTDPRFAHVYEDSVAVVFYSQRPTAESAGR